MRNKHFKRFWHLKKLLEIKEGEIKIGNNSKILKDEIKKIIMKLKNL